MFGALCAKAAAFAPVLMEGAPTGGELDNVNTVATTLLTMLGTVIATIVAHPILLVPIAAGFIGLAVGLFKKFRH